MRDNSFFKKAGPFSLSEIVKSVRGEVEVRGEKSDQVVSPKPLETATASDISFISNKKYMKALVATQAGVVIAPHELSSSIPSHAVQILSDDPYLAWAQVMALYFPSPKSTGVIHPSAIIAKSAKVADGVEIGAYAVIEEGAEIGAGTIIKSHAWIGPHVVVGPRCHIMAHTSISYAVIGEGCVIHSGAKIGEAGFGFAVNKKGGFETVPQVGGVELGKFVEVGANSTIDRGSVKPTILGDGTRIDNLVQIGHNVQTGSFCVIVAQAGIAGSTTLGNGVQVAAQAGLAGHLTVGSRARIGAQSGVMSDIEEKADVIGSPAQPFWEFFKTTALLRKMLKDREKSHKK